MQDRLLTALGALAAVAAVVAGFALLFSVLDDGGDASPKARTVYVKVPGGQTATGKKAKPGHVSVGAKVPAGEKPSGGQGTEGESEVEAEAGTGSETTAGGPAQLPTLAGRPLRGPAFQIAHVIEGERVDLYTAPNGKDLGYVRDETEFGSPVAFSVVETKPGWLGVTTPLLPNGELAWIARDPSRLQVYWTRYSLHASLAGRSLELRYGNRVVGDFSVTVGGPGTETPPGRYGVTDGVSFDESPYYGCCALALSGHQTAALPAGWIGGNRLAIHGTPGAVGGAESLGCIRATDETMRFLFARVPLGTPVFIDA
ncbi:MAG: L,D-transpeptidase [Actinobacteria bacterium]|nr:L,D-transpeptidase [Actinomycetota bacterium]